jgi:hypothetical protein
MKSLDTLSPEDRKMPKQNVESLDNLSLSLMDVILYQGEGVSRSPKLYSKPFPIKESMWKLPGDRNVWSQFRCKNFTCLASNNTFERDSSNVPIVLILQIMRH